jgi:hypothetical protein
MGFEWILLNGSCALCTALAGYHEEEPARPHETCDCDIFESDPGFPPGTCWGVVEIGSDIYVDGVVTIEVDVFKICANGTEVSTSFFIDQTFDEWYAAWFENENGPEWTAWHAEVDARIEGACAHDLEYECTTFVDPTP